MFAGRIKTKCLRIDLMQKKKGKEKDYDLSLAVGSRSEC
jgi:hypothetical protein